ncbi:MAG: PHP domain-containing protein [Candidatus Hydrogenedentes bacterium]|nr:PHP domain-containing protein [Candidatus Hydrogenedentota bacterium]
MGYRFDIHIHTREYSPCSLLYPDEMVESALASNLHGIVITEHHYQWEEAEIKQFKEKVNCNGLMIFSGAEITTDAGDLIVLGMPREVISKWKQFVPIEKVLEDIEKYSGFCIAAHPTRSYHHFDNRLEILSIPAIEVSSVNMNVYEQERAIDWARKLGRIQVCASDAHQVHQVGKYWLDFECPINTESDLIKALKSGKFKMGSR